ncbi:MAG: flagellar hook-basal body complex protein, partial [Selenomonadaceae bacterium]|nr:flagellar hook-basal body complex protein [Selenomonadaceae bacterium]
MMRSLFSGVSGLKGHQTRMDVIGNNIANVNTTGFKSSRATFADAISQTTSGASSPTGNLGGTNPKQIGLGSNVSSIDLIFTDGSVQSTGKNTDLCLSGSGLFVVKQGIQTYYTRNGAFEFDAEGNYVMPGSGLFVQGWMGEGGTVNTSGAVTNINVPSGKSMAARSTGAITYANNLNSDMLMLKSVTGGTIVDGRRVATASSAVTLTFSDNTTQTVTSGSYVSGHSMPITTTATVYDSLGTSHSVPILLEITQKNPGTGNTWTAVVAPTLKSGGVINTNILCADGTIITPTL